MRPAVDVFSEWADIGKDEGMERGHTPAVQEILHAAFDDIAISIADADCYSDKDRAEIMQLIGGRTEEVDIMIKKQMTMKPPSRNF